MTSSKIFFATFMHNKILDNFPTFEGKTSSCSKVTNKNVVGEGIMPPSGIGLRHRK